jgi:hypothetical protein
MGAAVGYRQRDKKPSHLISHYLPVSEPESA